MSGALQADMRRCGDSRRGYRSSWRLFAENYGLQALLAYRLGRWLLRHNRFLWWPALPAGWIFYYLLSRYVRLAFDIHLELSADIGPGLYIGHFGALHVGHCRIGANCSIACLTVIAPAPTGAGPIIGDRVWTGVNVQIIGPFRIGSDATVSAGAVVLGDIPEGALCMGNPARIVMRNYDNRGILGFTDEAATAAVDR
jgi:serine O-acetyltransferase